MDQIEQAKLYYLYMMADGELSANEKKLFNKICKELGVDSEDKKQIVKECGNMSTYEIYESINDLIDTPTVPMVVAIYSQQKRKQTQATILWNLVNLGYADANYSIEEKQIVDSCRKKWNIKESVYQEMIDVAETCLSLEKHKEWLESLDDSDYKTRKLKQLDKDMLFSLESIKTTISELKDQEEI